MEAPGGMQGTRSGSFHSPECKSFTEQGKTGEFSEYTFFVNFFFPASAAKLPSLPFLHSAIFSEKTEKPTCMQSCGAHTP